ncbi:MAG TPA: PHP domain-containing protein [Bryobacteraceae bacterium]|nr:PHP domain-containing protein [Bryobacteraceae bacterium]
MIDLHSHTTESDGSTEPADLIEAARRIRLDALAITDHDTLSGYQIAKPLAEAAGLRLICGIELSTKIHTPARKTVHLLGYFPDAEPTSEFLQWLLGMQAARRDRNHRLAARLQSMRVDITIEEVEALGRSMAGRPHFAKLMVQKGYVSSTTDAFRLYLDESAPGYVDREEPTLADGIARIASAGGISSVAHPIRLGKRNLAEEEELIASFVAWGLDAIEAYHSDHSPADVKRYLGYAGKYGLRVTGGSDYHGDNKPNVRLGGANVPTSLLDELRR